MQRSLNQLADQVINDVYAGLKAPADYSLSRRQVVDEIAGLRNTLIAELQSKGMLQSEDLFVTVPEIPLELNLAAKQLFCKIPTLLKVPGLDPILWAAPVEPGNKYDRLKIVYGRNHEFVAHDRWTATKPTILIEGTDAWVINAPLSGLKKIKLRMLPYEYRQLEDFGMQADEDTPYPLAPGMETMIVQRLTQKFTAMYRSQNPQPNRGADIIQQSS